MDPLDGQATTSVGWLTPGGYRRLQALVQDALDCPAVDRRAYIARACGGDSRLLAEALALLDAHLALEEPVRRAVPSTIGPYAIERELGRGGMGTVYLARRNDESYDKRVAIKLIRPDVDNAEVLARFRLERKILASLDHPNIARLIDGGATAGGNPYIVMDYVDGVPLTTFADRARLPIAERLAMFRTVCAAVEHAHQNLIVHRDIKPTNILVTAEGVPKLLDFGIAKVLTPGGRPAGDLTIPHVNPATPQYASPEQLAGDPVNTATDVYALGLVLFELLTARVPPSSERGTGRVTAPSVAAATLAPRDRGITAQAAAAARATTPERLAARMRGDIDAIVLMALRESVHERYRSVAELSEDVQRHLDRLPVVARPGTARYRLGRFIARQRTGIAAAALVSVTLMGGVVSTYYQWQRAEYERDRAEHRFDTVRALAMSVLDAASAPDDTGGATSTVRDEIVQTSLQSLGRMAQGAASDPVLLRELAAGYRRVGDVQRRAADGTGIEAGGALESYRRAQQLAAASAAADPSDAGARRALAESFERVGTLLGETGEVREGRENLRQSLQLYEALLDADRASATAQRDLMLAHLRYATAVDGEDRTAAGISYGQARQIADALLTRDPDDTGTHRDALTVLARVRAWQFERDPDALRADEARYFEAISESSDPARLEYFLERFPDGDHAGTVRARLAALRRGESQGRAVRPLEPPAPFPAPAATDRTQPAVALDVPGLEWRPVPAGRYQMGCDLRPDRQCGQDERPRHWVTLSRSFEMLATPVTLGQYRAYARLAGRPLPPQPAWNTEDRQPVVNITWDEANRFCAAVGGRLATEAQWEWAARGAVGDRVYPWGDTYLRTMANSGFPGRDGWNVTSPVGTFPANGYGLFDMVGNVWEWVLDWYDPRFYEQSPAVDPVGPSGGISRVLRGGSYGTAPSFLRITQRGIDSMDRRREATGFRCVR